MLQRKSTRIRNKSFFGAQPHECGRVAIIICIAIRNVVGGLLNECWTIHPNIFLNKFNLIFSSHINHFKYYCLQQLVKGCLTYGISIHHIRIAHNHHYLFNQLQDHITEQKFKTFLTCLATEKSWWDRHIETCAKDIAPNLLCGLRKNERLLAPCKNPIRNL